MAENLAQWHERSQQIIAQYMSYSSREAVEKLNRRVNGYYQRVYVAANLTNHTAPAVPIVYLSEREPAEVVLFNESLPPLLVIPNDQHTDAILPYAASRAWLAQQPALLTELTAVIQQQLPAAQYTMIRPWLPDLVSRLIGGLLLFDLKRFTRHLSQPKEFPITKGPAELPATIAIIVPYLGIAALLPMLKALRGQEEIAGKLVAAHLEQKRVDLDMLLQDHLAQPCVSLPNAEPVVLRDLRDAMVAAINLLCSTDTTLQAVGGKTFLDFLMACIKANPEATKVFPAKWGRLTTEQFDQFLQTLAEHLSTAEILPLRLPVSSGLQIAGLPDNLDIASVILACLLLIFGVRQ